jgi:hypothetical protein
MVYLNEPKTYPCTHGKTIACSICKFAQASPTMYGDRHAYPTIGEYLSIGPLLINIVGTNGDFRSIELLDHKGRPIANGSVPYSALVELEEEHVSRFGR